MVASTEETAVGGAVDDDSQMQKGAAANGESPAGDGGAQPTLAAAADADFAIDDDQDGFVDQPLDDEGEADDPGPGADGRPANVAASERAAGGDTEASAASTPQSSASVTSDGTSSNPKPKPSQAAGKSAIAAAAAAALNGKSNQSPQSPSPPRRLNVPAAKSHQAPLPIPSTATTSPKTQPKPNAVKRRKSPASTAAKPRPEETDESMFGPFVDPDNEWNPFGDGAVPGEMFSVDEDLPDQSNDAQNDTGLRQRNPSGVSGQPPKSPKATEAEMDALRRVFDSEYERALEDQEISWRARFGATRLSFFLSALAMVVYLWLGCLFYASEAGWSVPDALLFTVYTVTTVGYGGPQPLPNTAAFHAFTSIYVLVGISLVTVLGAHTYQLVTLEATRMRSSPFRKQRQNQEVLAGDFGQEAIQAYKQQFQQELEELVREQPLLEAAIQKCKETQHYMRTTKAGRVLAVVLPFTGMIFLGAIVVGSIEGWSPLESIYWSIVTLTTVGYGDYVPTRNSAVWFCTLFFIPSSLFFLSFFLAHVAKSYIRLHAIHVAQLEGRMRRKNETQRIKAARAEKARRAAEAEAEGAAFETENPSSEPATPASAKRAKADDEETGYWKQATGFTTTVISYTEDEDLDNSPNKSSGLFGDQAGMVDDRHNNDPLSSDSSPALRYRQQIIRNKEAPPDRNGNRVVTFAEALRSLNKQSARLAEASDDNSLDTSEGRARPSLDLRLRVQARLARIIAEEVAGYQTGVIIKGSAVSLTVGSLRETADKWKIPPQAWKAFRAVAFRSILFVGERELISEGGDALLRLNVVEFHQIFSPMLASMGSGPNMETWLAATDVLADVELRGGARYGRAKPIFNGQFT